MRGRKRRRPIAEAGLRSGIRWRAWGSTKLPSIHRAVRCYWKLSSIMWRKHRERSWPSFFAGSFWSIPLLYFGMIAALERSLWRFLFLFFFLLVLLLILWWYDLLPRKRQ